MTVGTAQLRVIDFTTNCGAVFGAARRVARPPQAPTKLDVVDPSGLQWTVRRLALPPAMLPPPPAEMLQRADPSHGWTPLPVGVVLFLLALPLIPIALWLRSLRVLPWTLEARAYPWGRRVPPIVFSYHVRGREEAATALHELAAALARGDGAPVVPGADRVP